MSGNIIVVLILMKTGNQEIQTVGDHAKRIYLIKGGIVMKKVILGVIVSLVIVSASFAGYVSGYVRSNGTYVAPHYRSDSNSTVEDNYSHKGNTNPYTGKKGTKSSIWDE